MHDGTIRNHTDDGILFSDLLISKGIIPIIKVDKGTVPYTNFSGEVLTQGLDDLAKRCDLSPEEILRQFKNAGLDGMPGGGAALLQPLKRARNLARGAVQQAQIDNKLDILTDRQLMLNDHHAAH